MGTRVSLAAVEDRIRHCQGRWTLVDADLAAWFGLPTGKLLDCVRDHEPVPGELAFHPDRIDFPARTDEARIPDYVFTEQGVVAVAFMLGSATAIARSIELIRVFAQRGHAPPRAIDFPELPRFEDPRWWAEGEGHSHETSG